MTLQDWGSIGELVGGVAVIASLVYVGFQVRQNTSAVRANSAQSFTDSINSVQLSVTSSVETAHAWLRFNEEPESLTAVDRVILDTLALAAFQTYDSGLLQAKLGSHRLRVGRRTRQADPQAGLCSAIPEDAGGGAVLAHHEVHPAVPVQVARGASPLLSPHPDARGPGVHGREPALAVAQEDEAQAGVASGGLQLIREEVLAEEDILVAVSVHVRHGDLERG